tara:strand:+ start:3228 stop:4163 length:936 start_codon:yes stop_codon:yes gene_type:complete
MTGKKAIVVGGAGFIGSNLVDHLLSNNIYENVVVVDDMSTGREENKNPNAFYYNCDFGDVKVYADELSEANSVFHLAAKARVQPSIKDPVSFDYTNVHSMVKLLKACVDNNVKNFVFSSSSSIYGDTDEFPTPETAPTKPMSPYGLQKLIGEQYCKLFSESIACQDGSFMNTTCLRYFNVYGDRMLNEGAYCLVMGVFDSLKKKGLPLTIYGDGNQLRDFTYVGDVVKANVAADAFMTKHGADGEIFNIGNGDNRSINQIASHYDSKIEHLPARLEPFKTLADNTKAKSILSWYPTGNVEEWLKSHLENGI